MLDEKLVETKPSELVYFNPYSEEEFRVVPAGRRPRLPRRFINDDFVKTFKTDKEAYNNKKNKFIDSIMFVGPYPAKVEKASRKKILICDPNTGGEPASTRSSRHLAHRAYRRPVTQAEVDALIRVRRDGEGRGPDRRAGHSACDPGDAGLAALPVPHRARSRSDRSAKVHPITDVELASRLSYFLWSSMPDDELLQLAEAGKLRAGMLDAQVKRMLDDPRSAALRRQLRRPVAGDCATWTASSPIRRSSPSGDPSCATR